jgi:predicted metal-dependent HD superfamily phosphohydrolase
MIRHIVTWKLQAQDEAAKADAFDQLAVAFGGLPHVIPEIKTLHLGRDLDETSGNWDVALVLDIASTADLDTYQVHPEHEKVKSLVRSLTSERSAIDFEF